MREYNVNSSEPMNAGTDVTPECGATPYGTIGYDGTNYGTTSGDSSDYQSTGYQKATNANGSIGNSAETNGTTTVPAKVSVWTKVKKFLCQDIVVDLTPKQEQAFKEIDSFWHQEVTWNEFKAFWLQDIEITL